MDVSVMEDLGFTKGEIRVYLALLGLGNTTSGPVILKSKVSRSKVYEILDNLKEKGLVTESIRENVRYFQATSPEKVLGYVDRKERELREKAERFEEVLPELIAKQKEGKEKQEVKVYVGYEGIKTFYNETMKQLKKGDEYLVITKDNSMWENESYSNFIINLHKIRLDMKLKVKCIFNSSEGKFKLKEFFRNKIPYYELREISFNLPGGLVIIKIQFQ